MNKNIEINFGSQEFWGFYDEFCKEENLRKLVEIPNFDLAKQMHFITKAAQLTREIHSLKRVDCGWETIHAWLTLKHANVQRYDGEPGIDVRPGDVIIEEHQWDRHVIITHSPIDRNVVANYLLSGRWEPMIGLFLPLFTEKTIKCAIKVRIEQNVKECLALTADECRDWEWNRQFHPLKS